MWELYKIPCDAIVWNNVKFEDDIHMQQLRMYCNDLIQQFDGEQLSMYCNDLIQQFGKARNQCFPNVKCNRAQTLKWIGAANEKPVCSFLDQHMGMCGEPWNGVTQKEMLKINIQLAVETITNLDYGLAVTDLGSN